MSELCLLIEYSLKVVIVVVIIWLMGWGGVGAFRWWQKHDDADFWKMWKTWLIVSIAVFALILIIYTLLPATVCRPSEMSNIPYYGR